MTEIHGASMQMRIENYADTIMRQEKIEALNNQKNIEQEHYNKKVVLDKLMLEAYYARLDALSIYTRKAELQSAQAVSYTHLRAHET